MGWTFTQRLRPMCPMSMTRVGRAVLAVTLSVQLAVPLAVLQAAPLRAAAAPARENQGHKQPSQSQEQIDLQASSVEADNPNKTADFTQIVITQGTMRIEAERAHAVGFTGMEENNVQDGRWTFTGNVHIYAEPRGTLQSDQAVVEMKNRRMTTATATGKPAEFQQRHPTTGELTHGHADLIVYDIDAGTMRLTNNAFISTGRQTINSPSIVYNIRQQRVLADSGNKGTGKANVHVTIVPQSNPNPMNSTVNSTGASGEGASGPGVASGPGGAPAAAAGSPSVPPPAQPQKPAAPPKKPQNQPQIP